ncbi:kinesin-like protein NACK2 [Apium graveolens]|uniref:kinesin-like protein NACK2 n=1 Tax=Apium graveolens TaxID=4045 RepID=UPI003D7947A7
MTASTPRTPASKIRRAPSNTPGGPKVSEEKILVTVRLRPLNSKEQAAYDLIAWDCKDDQTIVSRNLYHDRHTGPYTFDKVFDPVCSTQKVYEEGARDVALSALNGINSTIFAYGQTSSGKTFTMRGITENAVKDIYEHIENTIEKEFVLKLSALEIYNETVVDLLNRDSGSLRLLDDPEKGTIVEKLTEEVVTDEEHLRHLIDICEAQRQVGETSLNDKSSRSHQIIRLTIESTLRENSGRVNSFLASLSLVDLAGSERVSQTNADGTRLKEGSHINRSLLTLTTVIRKLSGGKRSGHIPYRDSKLTRILQSSLGGNARTAIICTMSPALSHVEQSRNTLSFATSAKEVTNSAQVNMVVTEKQLVKHLQKEVARLNAELQSPEPTTLHVRSLLMEKDRKIQQMEIEMNELKRQRDLAESQLEHERSTHKEQKGSVECGPSCQVAKRLSYTTDNDSAINRQLTETLVKKTQGRQSMLRQSVTSTDPSMLVHEIRKLEMLQRQLGEEATQALELLHKEVASNKVGSQETTETIAKLLSDIKDMHAVSFVPLEVEIKGKASLKEELTRLNSEESNITSLEEKLENVQKSIDRLVMCFSSGEETPDCKIQSKKKKILPFNLSNTPNMPHIIRSPCSLSSRKILEHETENRAPERNESSCGSDSIHRLKVTPRKSHEGARRISSREATPSSRSNSVNVKKLQKMFKTAAEENIQSIKAYVTELKERVAKLQYQKQLLVCQVLEMEANEAASDESDTVDQSPLAWHLVFEEQRKQIIMLWHLCHVSIIHRTQFYMLFRGDPADQIYIEVELRRLTWLEQHLAALGNASPALLGDEAAGSVVSSIRALKQEREYLAKRVSSKLSAEEREMLYLKWDVPVEGKQKRRLQLVNKLWTDPLNMQHVRESAEIVAKLVGFCEAGDHVSKEMFQLNFVPPSDKKTWMGWNLISNLLHL